MLNYPYMAIYKHIATGLQLHNSPQSNRRYCSIIACSRNYSLHYPRFIARISASNFMHMDTVGLSRGAPDCSETNFTIISFGGGEWLRAFIYQISENDNFHKLCGGKDENLIYDFNRKPWRFAIGPRKFVFLSKIAPFCDSKRDQ